MSFLNYFILFLLGTFIVFSILFLLFLTFNVISLFSGAPYVKSKRKTRREMLRIARIKKDDVVFDLGSGDGTLLIEAVKGYNLKEAYGIEINPLLVLISRIKILLSGVQSKIKIKQGNFLKQDLSQATVIFSYLLPSIQVKLERKFKKELRPDTRIISNAFLFPNLSLRQKVCYPGSNKIKECIREYIIN